MIVSINQPAYLPWLGYFDRIKRSDLHIVLDHVQFEKNSVTNRNKIRTPQGWTWLTVPVSTKGRFGTLPINALEISPNTPWQQKHWKALTGAYSRAPYFTEYRDRFDAIYRESWLLLAPLATALTADMLAALRINTPITRSSLLKPTGRKSELVLNLCRAVGATTYLSGPLGRDYLDLNLFDNAGISVQFHDYVHPVYPQTHGGFEPYMAAIDLLFNTGPEAQKILTTGERPTLAS